MAGIQKTTGFVGPQVRAARTDAAPTVWKIKSGDTLSAIAKRTYKDASLWKAIQAANPGVIPERLKVGARLNLPSLEEARTLAKTETQLNYNRTGFDAAKTKPLSLDGLNARAKAATATTASTPALKAADSTMDGNVSLEELDSRMAALQGQVDSLVAKGNETLAKGGKPSATDVAAATNAQAELVSLFNTRIGLVQRGAQAGQLSQLAHKIDSSPDNKSAGRNDGQLSGAELQAFVRRQAHLKVKDPQSAEYLGLAKNLMKLAKAQSPAEKSSTGLALDALKSATNQAQSVDASSSGLTAADSSKDGKVDLNEIVARKNAITELVARGTLSEPELAQAEAEQKSLSVIGLALQQRAQEADQLESLAKKIDASVDNKTAGRNDGKVSTEELEAFIKFRQDLKAKDPSRAESEDLLIGIAQNLLKLAKDQ